MANPLDDFIPAFDARERYAVRVRAPAALVYQAAMTLDMQSIPLVRAIFWLRGKVMGSAPVRRKGRGFRAEMTDLGWACLVERPGTLFMAGVVCQPWLADVVFSPIAPDRFKAFAEADQVKIAWTVECQALGTATTELASETRVQATNAAARVRFLRYWRWARLGILPIRWLLLPAIRTRAEADYRHRTGRQGQR